MFDNETGKGATFTARLTMPTGATRDITLEVTAEKGRHVCGDTLI